MNQAEQTSIMAVILKYNNNNRFLSDLERLQRDLYLIFSKGFENFLDFAFSAYFYFNNYDRICQISFKNGYEISTK